MQYLTLCALLLCVLSVAHCENITKLTTHAIRHPNEVLYATTEVWYRSAKNEAVRLSHPDQRLPLPEPLLSFETMFLELSNNRVLMYAVGSNTSTPFYVIDGVSITQYYARSPGVPNTLKKMEYTISHGNDYVIGVFENRVQGYLNYTAICTSLNTSSSVILPYALAIHGSSKIKIYSIEQLFMQPTTNGFYMVAATAPKYKEYSYASSKLAYYDPHLNSVTMYDEIDTVSRIPLVGDNLILRTSFGTKTHNIYSGEQTKIEFDTFGHSGFVTAELMPGSSNFAIIGLFDSSFCVPGKCKNTKAVRPWLSTVAGTSSDTFVYTTEQESLTTRLLSYSISNAQVQELHPNVMPALLANHWTIPIHIKYDSVSDSALMLGIEQDARDSRIVRVQLIRFDLENRTLHSYNLCNDSCVGEESMLQLRDDTIWMIKKENNEWHMFKLFVRAPVLIQSNIAIIVGVSVGGATLLLLVAIIGILVCIRKRFTKSYVKVQE